MTAQLSDDRTNAGRLAFAPLELRFDGRDEWHAGLSRYLLPLDCSAARPQSFRCSAVVARLGSSTVAELRADAARLVRRPAEVTNGQGDLVKVFWQLEGRSQVAQGRNRAMLEPGLWTVCDARREYAIDLHQDARFQLMLLPRAHCPGWLAAIDALGARALPNGGPAHIARTALGTMLRDISSLDAQSEGILHDSVVALVGRALALALRSRGLAPRVDGAPDLAGVQAWITQRLSDCTLTVDRVAAAFQVSRRSLYNLFEPSGITPHAFMQTARLTRAAELLCTPGPRKAPVAEVARLCGFVDPAHFTRAFHAHHGVAPTALRDEAN